MSHSIDSARKDLSKALKHHAKVVSAEGVTLKKAQRAAAIVQAAVLAYATVVQARTGIESPFPSDGKPGLEASTLASLIAERDSLAKKTRTRHH